MTLKQQLDRERQDFEDWACTVRDSMTIEQYNFARDAWLERARRAQERRQLNALVAAAGQEAVKAFDEHAPMIAQSMEEHVAAGEGRN